MKLGFYFYSTDTPHSFIYGLIFTNKRPIGQAVLSFLQRLQFKPAKIIMIDNSRDNLDKVEVALESTGIQFEGFRYGRSDILKANFDPMLGTIQFFSFFGERKRIMSDEEAMHIKQTYPEINYDSLLDNYIGRQIFLYQTNKLKEKEQQDDKSIFFQFGID